MMSEEHETVADIVAEMREHGAAISGLLIPDDDGPTRAMTPDLADRLEAAAKRERETSDLRAIHRCHDCELDKRTGDAAKMREALESIVRNLQLHIMYGRHVAPGDHVSFHIHEAEAYIRDARAALAAPPRNCDKFLSRDEAWATFERLYFGPTESEFILDAFIDWLFDTDGKVDEAAKNGGNQ